MLRVNLSVNHDLVAIDDLSEKGIWINLVNPDESELNRVAEEAGIYPDFLRAALDEEERPRLEAEEGQLLVLINVPIEGSSDLPYDTIPLGIIVSEGNVVTVCLHENLILKGFGANRHKTFQTYKRTRFVLQLLFQTASQYLRYLRQIDKRTSEIENQLHKSMKNEELFRLLSLEKSLVYFTTSLKANEAVMEKLLKSHLTKADPDMAMTSQILKMYADDEDLLEDVIIENKQAIDMSEIHSNILSGMMDAFASVISNNLNIVMKLLASITIVLALPTMVASFFGMNVDLPLQHSPFSFIMTIGISLVLSLIGAFLLRRKNMF